MRNNKVEKLVIACGVCCSILLPVHITGRNMLGTSAAAFGLSNAIVWVGRNKREAQNKVIASAPAVVPVVDELEETFNRMWQQERGL
jgi:hypothetical protein